MARAPQHARRRARRDHRGARWATAALVVAGLATGLAVASTSGASRVPPPSYIAAANYFGGQGGNAYNLWNASLANVKPELSQMKKEGFNAVALVVPWGEFQTGLTPVRYNQQAFSRLDMVLGDAKSLGMGVILRLSYFWDIDPADQMPTSARFNALWGTSKVYSSWLAYIGKIHQDVSTFGNVWGAYLSWEDLWQPVQEAQATTTAAQQLHLAKSSGFQSWLRSHSGISLSKIGTEYGTTFTSFSQVPTPSANRPSFRLMFQYEDWGLIHHLFQPASKRFPGLTLEARVDIDAIKTGTQVVGSYAHTAQFQLAGTSLTGIYDTPYMGDTAPTKTETATQAVASMQRTFSTLSAKAGGRRLFVYEYQFGPNPPEIAGTPQLIATQIPQYLSGSAPLLKQYTAGYALWTYRDFNLSGVYNPSFTLGSQGWKLSGGARAVHGFVQLHGQAKATQKLVMGLSSATPATFSFSAHASGPATVLVQVGRGPTQSVPVTAGEHTYNVTLPPSATATSLSLRSSGSVAVTNVQLYQQQVLGNVYNTTGSAEIGAAPLRAMNQQLTGK